MKHLRDFMQTVMANGKPQRLIQIVDAVHSLGWKSSSSSRYIQVYHELREHPEMFKRVGWGTYQLCKVKANTLHSDDLRGALYAILIKRPRTATQAWRALQKQGITIDYKAVHRFLQDAMFDKDDGKYFVC